MLVKFYPFTSNTGSPLCYHGSILAERSEGKTATPMFTIDRSEISGRFFVRYRYPRKEEIKRSKFFDTLEGAMIFCQLIFDDIEEIFGGQGYYEYGEFDSTIRYHSDLARKKGLELPLISPEYHMNKKHRPIESRTEKEINSRLTEQVCGTFLCDNGGCAEILSKHGWAVSREEEPRLVKDFANGGKNDYYFRFWRCENKRK